MIQPNIFTGVDLDPVPVLSLARPVLWYARIRDFEVAEYDVARAFDCEAAADKMRGRPYTYDSLVARDRYLEALWVGHNLPFNSDDQWLFSTGIIDQFLVGSRDNDITSFSASGGRSQRRKSVCLIFAMLASRLSSCWSTESL